MVGRRVSFKLDLVLYPYDERTIEIPSASPFSVYPVTDNIVNMVFMLYPRSMNNRVGLFLLIFILFAYGPRVAHGDEIGLTALSIHASAGIKKFMVEVASTSEDRQRGLMFRKLLPDDQGMLFDYQSERIVNMWMKNTFISLDMLFISENGTIMSFAKDTVPHSLETISSTIPVRAVLELKAGSIEKHGIQIGDRITHAIFGSP